jgi:hypothetical protein
MMPLKHVKIWNSFKKTKKFMDIDQNLRKIWFLLDNSKRSNFTKSLMPFEHVKKMEFSGKRYA